MFSRIVAIEPVSLIPSAEEALHTFANEVVMYPDIPADDEEIVRRIGDADAVLLSYTSSIRREVMERCPNIKYIGMCCSLYSPERYQGHRYPGLWRRRSSRICHQRTGTLLPRIRPAGLGRRGS